MRQVTRWAWMGSVGVVVVGLLGAAALGAQQTQQTPPRTFPVPTVDTGPVPIEGRVAISNIPTVSAAQSGPWTVKVDGPQDVHVLAPAFLKVGETFSFRWTMDREERYKVVSLSDGWVLGEAVGGPRPGVQRWLNPSLAISIQELGPAQGGATP
jgi:hypothetical protein